jgi:hypothetical protein
MQKRPHAVSQTCATLQRAKQFDGSGRELREHLLNASLTAALEVNMGVRRPSREQPSSRSVNTSPFPDLRDAKPTLRRLARPYLIEGDVILGRTYRI